MKRKDVVIDELVLRLGPDPDTVERRFQANWQDTAAYEDGGPYVLVNEGQQWVIGKPQRTKKDYQPYEPLLVGRMEVADEEAWYTMRFTQKRHLPGTILDQLVLGCSISFGLASVVMGLLGVGAYLILSLVQDMKTPFSEPLNPLLCGAFFLFLLIVIASYHLGGTRWLTDWLPSRRAISIQDRRAMLDITRSVLSGITTTVEGHTGEASDWLPLTSGEL